MYAELTTTNMKLEGELSSRREGIIRADSIARLKGPIRTSEG
jgi:hypothetical protein